LAEFPEPHVKKKIRAVQYGVGPIGSAIVRLLREKVSMEIIGAIDIDPLKVGRDLGELVGAADAPWGIVVSDDVGEVLGMSPDVVIHSTASSLPRVADQLRACLGSGACVVSTCEELSYPYRKYPGLAAQLDAEAKAWGVALVGTGINPGFVMDKLLITLSAACQEIHTVRASRIVDASKRRMSLQKKIGAGMTTQEFRTQVAAGVIKHHGLPESVAMVADALGLSIDVITERIDPVVAESPIKTEFFDVAAGQVAGVYQIAQGLCAGEERIHMELQMYVGAPNPADSVAITGTPSLSLTIPGGTHGDIASAAVLVNSISAILDAPAGLRTSRDLPLSFLPPNARP
jgi:hypothetical protein